MSSPRDIDVVLFDIGGVIVRMNDITALGTFHGRTDSAGIMELWLDCPIVAAHERGEIDATEFARCMVETYRIGCAAETFLARFAEWPREPFAGVEETLRAIRPEVRIACLSNTCDFHWRNQLAAPQLARLFATQFLSYRLGVMKPDPAIYRTVAAKLACAPERILFFDDTERHVAGARAVGFQAHRVSGIAEARPILETLGLLRAP